MADRPKLSVGDRCRLLYGTLLYNATVTEVSTHFEGEPGEFSMYGVRSEGHDYLFIREQRHHRHDLFLPTENEALLRELEERIDSLENIKRDIEEEMREVVDEA